VIILPKKQNLHGIAAQVFFIHHRATSSGELLPCKSILNQHLKIARIRSKSSTHFRYNYGITGKIMELLLTAS
jgi:hypothetical protein